METLLSPLVAQVPGLSRAGEVVVLNVLAKDPKDRFMTVQAFTFSAQRQVFFPQAESVRWQAGRRSQDRWVRGP